MVPICYNTSVKSARFIRAPRTMRARQAVLLTPSKSSCLTQLLSCKQAPAITPFRINTCKSVSKQRTLTSFTINTYEKHRGEGVLLLTRNPKKDFYPEGAPRLKDLSSFPMWESVLRSTATRDLSSNPKKARGLRPGGTHEGLVAGDACPAFPDPVGERPLVPSEAEGSEARDLSINPAGNPRQTCLLRTSRRVNSVPHFQLSTFDFQPPLRTLPFALYHKSVKIRMHAHDNR
jgi:hypothetical protein